MENANKVQHWNNSLARPMDNVRPTLVVGIVLTVMLAGLTGFNPLLGMASALVLFLLVLVVSRPVMIVYGLVLIMPLTDGLARRAIFTVSRLGPALSGVGFILFFFASPVSPGQCVLSR